MTVKVNSKRKINLIIDILDKTSVPNRFKGIVGIVIAKTDIILLSKKIDDSFQISCLLPQKLESPTGVTKTLLREDYCEGNILIRVTKSWQYNF